MRGAFVGGALAAMIRWYPARHYDLVVAVSSGAASAAYYVTEKEYSEERVNILLNVWRHEISGGRLISLKNLLRGKSYLDQAYLVDELFGNKYRILREHLDDADTTPLYVTLSNLQSLRPDFVRATSRNLLSLLKAGMSLPLATRGRFRLDGELYTDGGVLAPMPLEEVIAAGYSDVTVVLTNPRVYRQKSMGRLVGHLCYLEYPAMAGLLAKRMPEAANRGYDLAVSPPAGVKVRIVDPPETLPAGMLDTDSRLLNETVDMGFDTAYNLYSGDVRAGTVNRLGDFLRKLLNFLPSRA